MTAITALTAVSVSCGNSAHEQQDKDFRYLIDEFADLKIMRYRIPGWDGLTLQQKEYDGSAGQGTHENRIVSAGVRQGDWKMEQLKKDVVFSFWEKKDEDHTVVRFATSWATRMEDVEKLAALL